MRDAKNINALAALHPEYMGFIFYKKSKRYVGDDFMVPTIDDTITKVGVFVNETTEEIIRLANKNSLTHLQLHGDESASQCEELRQQGFTIIKAFSISSDFDFNLLKPYKTVCNYFLFDTKGEGYGGNGQTFDWNVLTRYDQEIPFFLSGGLSPSNVEKALALQDVSLHGLDVNSGFEIEPGLKNISNLERLFEIRI